MANLLEDRVCTRCGQPVNAQRDSWKGTATGIAHTSCPTSPEMKQIPTLRQDVHPAAGLPPGAASAMTHGVATGDVMLAAQALTGVDAADLLRSAQALGGISAEEAKRLIATLAPRPQFISMNDAAKMLAVSVDTIRRRIRSGELPAKRLRGTSEGGRQTILIDQADVLALLEDYTGTEAGG